ncbi:hypothetical protein DRE_04908 [Drechslerella stenobrocha 248]|uniref:Uncharacterized protein n=1 Tax=Drechslerella stenobrocha 248 TaxID=1043628 RepID=W7HP74_9PEZI|nr:hypothetical protein DRE_04908 [Drechslerella stenobrocha 248]
MTTPADKGASPSHRSSGPRSPAPQSFHGSPQPIVVERPSSNVPKAGPSLLKKASSKSPKKDKTVKFAVDDYDRPLSPSQMHQQRKSPKVAGEPRKTDMRDNLSGFPTNGCGHGDFTLFPSPLPSPPQSPLFVPPPPPKSYMNEEARMRARQQRLEEEIAELNRRAVAREANHREQIRRRVIEFESSSPSRNDKRSREIDIEGSFSRRVASRRRSEDGSIDLSPSPRHVPARLSKDKTFSGRFTGAFSTSQERSSFFPTPLSSPAISQVRTTMRFETTSRPLSRRQSHSPTRRSQMSLSPRGECYRPRSLDSISTPALSADSSLPVPSSLPRPPSFQAPRGRSATLADNRPRGRSLSPADSICAVVGDPDAERELATSSDIEMTDGDHDTDTDEDNTSTTTSSNPCRDRRQCERCGLFGHELAECQTPALTLPFRRNRKREWEPESPRKEELSEGPPAKGLRHVKWMHFEKRERGL